MQFAFRKLVASRNCGFCLLIDTRGVFQPRPCAVCVTSPGSDRFLINPSVFAQAAKMRPVAHIYSSQDNNNANQLGYRA